MGVTHVDVLPVAARTRGRMRLRRVRRALITGAAAAATTGIVSAVLTRILMRATAVLLKEPTSFSLAGSAGIALIYTVALLPGCITVAATRQRWSWFVLAAGAAVLLFEAANIGVEETATARDLSAVRTVGLGFVLTAMTAVYAVQIYSAGRWAATADTGRVFRPGAADAHRGTS